MFLGSNESVLRKVVDITAAQPPFLPLRIAVAFWGDGAESIISPGRQYQIICNLAHGGTNPAVIRTLRAMANVKVRHLPDLHAKVVVAEKKAIVGSANFSAAGLGLTTSGPPSWLEAAAVIDAADVSTWFDSHWLSAREVSDVVLAQAELAWANRGQPQPCAIPSVAVPQLAESELFKPTITGGNMIRMAARPIELIYFENIEPETKRSVWNPAYAAALLWTSAGHRIQTRIEHCPYFEKPSDVLARAKHLKTINKVHRFIALLLVDQKVSPALRHWAGEYLRNAT
jgi:hypothetical protein